MITMMAQVSRTLGEHPTDQPDAWMRAERAFQMNILGSAEGILQPEQLPAFREALQQQLEASQLAGENVPGATLAPPIPGR